MNNVKWIAVAIGRAKLAAALGVGSTAISNACTNNIFPASWFAVISSLCEEAGIDCPIVLFKMRDCPEKPLSVAKN